MKNHKKTGSKQGQNRVNPPKNRVKIGSIFGSKQGQNRVNPQGQTSPPPVRGGRFTLAHCPKIKSEDYHHENKRNNLRYLRNADYLFKI